MDRSDLVTGINAYFNSLHKDKEYIARLANMAEDELNIEIISHTTFITWEARNMLSRLGHSIWLVTDELTIMNEIIDKINEHIIVLLAEVRDYNTTKQINSPLLGN